jgi:hypothetical protein
MDAETLAWILSAGLATGLGGLDLFLVSHGRISSHSECARGIRCGRAAPRHGHSPPTAIGIAAPTGTVEPPAALLAFAAGAMLSSSTSSSRRATHEATSARRRSRSLPGSL